MKEPDSALFAGGEMGAAMRALDWSRTPLGAVSQWPQSLKTVIRLMLDSRYAMWLAWGPELTFFCNDAYRPTLGVKRDFLGTSARHVWAEIWSDIGPRIERVLTRGEATWDEGLLLFLERRGFKEETYHSFSYSPVYGDTGRVEGMLCVVTEDTQRTIGERRVTALGALSQKTLAARSVNRACELAAEALSADPHDIPLALIYVVEPGGKTAMLRARAGVGNAGAWPAQPLGADAPATWPLARAFASGEALDVVDVVARIGPHSAGPWPEPVERARVLPLTRAGHDQRVAGFLVAGISPRLPFDDGYKQFLNLVAAQVGNALSDARAFEEERRRAEALAELDRAKTTFFSNVSHELRTPLTLMLSPLEDLLEREDDAQKADLLALVRRSGARLERLVNTLLDFSRIEAGRMRPAFEALDLACYTAELASMFRSAIERAGLRFSIDCPPLPQPVYADPGMWERIVLNLLSNAFKFTFVGEIRVALRAEGQVAWLVVSDTGIGIEPAAQARIFERFFRVEGARGRSIEGSGIGLALVAELARLQGGDVHVESTPGQGSVFSVRIPFGNVHLPSETGTAPAVARRGTVRVASAWLDEIQERRESEFAFEDRPSLSLPSAATPDPASDPPTVLVADDNPDMRDYLRRLLGGRYRVLTAADGNAALTMARSHQPDLVLSDVMMPGLDGFALLQALRADADTAAVPIILLSARAGEEARLEGLQAGADDYLTKPFHARELLARVDGVIALARTRLALARHDAALRESESRHRFLVSLNEATRRLTDPRQILAATMKLLGEYLHADRCLYGQVGDDEDAVEIFGTWVRSDDMPLMQGQVQLSDFGAEHVRLYRIGEPFVVDNVEVDPRVAELRPAYRAHSVVANLSFGLLRDGKLVAVIGIHQREPRHWLAADVALAQSAAARIWDTLERARAQQALERAHEALQQTDRRKDEFLATLAHELRNPLAPLRNAVQLLQMSPNREAAVQLHAMMKRQVDHLVRLVDDLLEVARISAGKIELQRTLLPLAGVLAGAVETSRPWFDASGHRLDLDLVFDEPMFVDGDPVRLAQVFSNLLNNAAKYTDPGGHIVLAARREEEHALVSVRDNGMGIEPHLLPRVFDMFAQADARVARTQGGLGIGLSLARNLLEMHGGTIEARSDGPGCGSEFIVRLPLVAGTHTENVETAAPLPATERIALPVRVLVCDDNRDAADSLGRLLEVLGARATVVHDGPAAIKAAREVIPQIILLDIGMPQMDGYMVARELRKLPETRTATLAALTGWGQQGDHQRSVEAGFDEHIVKPVEIQVLQRLMIAAREKTRTDDRASFRAS